MKFSFKEHERPTGLARIGHKRSWDIKLNGKKCGLIYHDLSFGLMVIKKDILEDNNPNCIWRWAMIKRPTHVHSINEMKTWLKSITDTIIRTYNLRLTEC